MAQIAQVALLFLGLLVQRSSQGFLTSGHERNHGNQLVLGGPGPSHGGVNGFQENTGFQGPFQGQGAFQVSGPFQASGPFPASGPFQGHGNFQGQGNYQGSGNFQGQGNYQNQGNFQGQGNHQRHGHFQGQGNFQGHSNFQDARAQSSGMNHGHHGGFSPEPHVSIQPASVKVVYVPVVSTSIKASSLSKLTGEQALSKAQGDTSFQGPVQQNPQSPETPKSSSYSGTYEGKAAVHNKPFGRSSTGGHATIPIIIIQKEHHSHIKSQQSGGGYQTQPVQSVQTQGNGGQGYMKQGYSSVGPVQQQTQQQQQQQQRQQHQPQQQQQLHGYGALAKHTQGGGAVIPVIIIQKTSHAGGRHQHSGYSFQASPPPVRGPSAWSPWR